MRSNYNLPIHPETLIQAKERQANQGIIIKDETFPEQDAFVSDTSTFIEACCTRRAGKSSGLGLRFYRTMDKYPGEICRYIALTRDSAKDIMWPVLQELDEKYKIGCKFTESNLTVTMKNDAKLRLYGADMQNFIRRLRGVKNPGIAIDEAQEFGKHLQYLVDDILTPTIADYHDGWLGMTGTPGAMPVGFFHEVSELRRYGFSHHSWSLLDNPYMPNAQVFLSKLKEKKGWDDNNPTYLREWCGKWVQDLQALVYHYSKEKNHYEILPLTNPIYIMGIDFGFEDADAISILAWDEKSPTTYLVDELVIRKQGLTELVEQVNLLRKKYDISKIVGDFGGLGKKLAEEMIRRYQIPIVAADKVRKAESIEIFNDAMRTSRFKARHTSQFAQDSMLLKWDLDKSTPDRKVISARFHSDACDSALYAFRESPAYSWTPEVAKPKYGTAEWANDQVTEMEEAAEKFFQEQEELKNSEYYGF